MSESVALSAVDLEEAWNAREMALTMTRTIQTKLGPLLSVVMVVDVLCLNTCFANILYTSDTGLFRWDDHVRNAAEILEYLATLLCVSFGLITLHDVVSQISRNRDSY